LFLLSTSVNKQLTTARFYSEKPNKGTKKTCMKQKIWTTILARFAKWTRKKSCKFWKSSKSWFRRKRKIEL